MKVPVRPIMPENGQGNVCGSVDSDVFEVYSAVNFPGTKVSTLPAEELKRQSAFVSLKKGEGFAEAGVAAVEEQKRGGNDSGSKDKRGSIPKGEMSLHFVLG